MRLLYTSAALAGLFLTGCAQSCSPEKEPASTSLVQVATPAQEPTEQATRHIDGIVMNVERFQQVGDLATDLMPIPHPFDYLRITVVPRGEVTPLRLLANAESFSRVTSDTRLAASYEPAQNGRVFLFPLAPTGYLGPGFNPFASADGRLLR